MSAMKQNSIRIMRLIARLNVGGPAIHTILLTQRMQKLGYETMLVSGREGPREGNMYALAEQEGVTPTFIEELGREVSWRDDYQSYKAICCLIREFRPHILHTHTAKAGTLGRLAARRCGVPVVIHTFHGHVLEGYFGPLKTLFYRKVETFLARRSDRLIAVGQAACDDLVSFGVAPAQKFSVIPLGLNLEQFRDAKQNHGGLRQELGLSEDDFLVGIVARLVPIKNHQELFKAAQILHQSIKNMHFIIVGDGELRSELESSVREMGISECVHFLGMRHDLCKIYADLDMSVLTSKNEGLPVALLESLASGTPILGSDVGATYEFKQAGWLADVYPPGNIDHFVNSVRNYYENRELYLAMAQESKADVIRRYSIDRLVSDLDALYHQLLREKGVNLT